MNKPSSNNYQQSMAKKLLFLIFSIFLVFRSIELIKFLYKSYPTQFDWVEIVAVSFTLNLFVTGVFAFLGFAFLTSSILPNSYYRIKNPKTLMFIFNILGVAYFKWILLKCYWGTERNRKKYFNGTQTGIDNFDIQTRQSEFGHLAAFVFILLVSLILFTNGFNAIVTATMLINVIANLYPIILQRTHRVTIEKLRLISSARIHPL